MRDMAEKYDYDVAFSFAGEDRQIVESLADRLKQQNVSVFYDRDKQAQMSGENLQEYLTDIYLKQARFCVMFISQAYAEKMWTRQERRSAMARAMQQKQAYILPIRLDQTELEGLLPTVHYVNFSDYTEEEIVGLILVKLDTGDTTQASQVRALDHSILQCLRLRRHLPHVRRTFSQGKPSIQSGTISSKA